MSFVLRPIRFDYARFDECYMSDKVLRAGRRAVASCTFTRRKELWQQSKAGQQDETCRCQTFLNVRLSPRRQVNIAKASISKASFHLSASITSSSLSSWQVLPPAPNERFPRPVIILELFNRLPTRRKSFPRKTDFNEQFI